MKAELLIADLQARNRMSHTYDAVDALKVYEKLQAFVTPLRELVASVKAAASNV